jgi:hypothetical protein
VAHVVMSACRFGCDELYERGYRGRRRRPAHPQPRDRDLGTRPCLRGTAPQGKVLWTANDRSRKLLHLAPREQVPRPV